MADENPQAAQSADADAEAEYQALIRRDLRRNYTAHLLHGLFGQTGFRLVNAPTFLPAYVLMLSGSEFVVGLVRALQYLGMFLSPLIGASLIEHRRRVLPIGFGVGFGMRLQVLGIALAGILLPPRATVIAIGVFLFLFGFFMGMQGVIFNYLMSKVIPVDRRGFLVGLRNSLAGLTAACVAYLGGKYLIEPNVLGHGYPLTFLLAFALTCLGLSMLLLIREPQPPVVRSPLGLGDRLRELPALLQEDRAFTVYFACRALATMGRMAVPFYVLYVADVIGELDATGQRIPTGATIGILSTAFIIANSVTNFAWGALADRRGFRLVFIISLGVWALCAEALLWGTSLPHFVAAFVGIGMGMGGFQMAAQSLVLEFGGRSDLPVRIALANSAQEFVGFIGPLIGGAIAVAVSKQATIHVAAVCQLLAIALVFTRVEDPRYRRS